MLEIRNLTKIYKPKKGVPVKALDNVSLKFPDCGMVFILGKSGSGKSTLLNVLGGLDSFTSGEFIIKGEEAKGFKQMHYDSYRNTYIGFIFQEYNILKDFSVGANIALALELQGQKNTNEEINRILKEVDLEGYGDRKPNELSGGQMQRVAIARALVKNPKIIMADEPTGALDSKTGEAIFETLKKLSKDKLVLIVSHDREFSEKYADRIIELADGKVISDVSLKEKKDEAEPIANVTFTENSVLINNGFALSEEEFHKIKEFIKNYNGPVDLNLASYKGLNNRVFENTDIGNIQMDNSGFKLIKSKLSLKNSFKIGASSLKHKKAKLIFTILLSFIAFTFFGLADTVAAYDLKRTAVNSIIDTKIDYASIVKKIRHDIGDEPYFESRGLSEEDISYLKTKTGLSNLKGVYYNDATLALGLNSFYSLVNVEDYYALYSFYTTSFNGVLEFDQKDIEQYGYKLLAGSKMANGALNEIMLTKYEAMTFVGRKLNIMDDYGTIIKEEEIKTETDLINKTFYLGNTNYLVTGIIDTNMNVERFSKLKEKTDDSFDLAYLALSLELESLRANSLNSLLFVGKGFCDRLGISKINTITDCGVGSFRLTNQGTLDDLTYRDYVYVNQFSFPTLINEDQNRYFMIMKDNQDLTTINENQVVLSNSIMYQLIYNYLYYNSTISNLNSSKYDKMYQINDNSYSVFTLLGLTSSSTLDDLLLVINPSNPSFGAMAYALELLSEDYESWLNLATDAQMAKDESDIDGIIQYIINRSQVLSYSIADGTDLSKEMHRMNSELIFKVFQDLEIDPIQMMFESYDYDDAKACQYQLDVCGVSYPNNCYYNSYVILNDEIWNKYFDYDPYEIYSVVVGEMTPSRDLVRKLIDMTLDETKPIKYELTNNVIDEVFGLKEVFDIMARIFIWVGVIFAIFACLLLSNFIATSISYKKEEIGILRAIGSRSNDVFRIFFSEAFIIALINFILASLATLFITILINRTMRLETALQITIVSFGIRQIIVLLILCVGSAFISSFLPVYKNARKKPIDAIRNR